MTGWRFRQSPRRGAPVSPEFPAPPVGPLVSNQLISRAHIGAPVSSWKCAAIKQKTRGRSHGRKMVVGLRFERRKAKPADLQSAPVGHFGNPPENVAYDSTPLSPSASTFLRSAQKSQGSREDGSIRSECAHKRPRSFHPSPWRAKARDNAACAGWGGVMHA